MKRCSTCRVDKSLAEFYPERRGQPKLASQCKPCARESSQRNKVRRRENGQERTYNRTRAHKAYAIVLQTYGLSPADYHAWLDKQHGVCAICQEPERATVKKTGTLRTLAVDHDHATGAVRGLLCSACNRGLGYLRDDPDLLRGALAYLTRNS